MGWALFHHKRQVSKTYPLREQALIDAVERKVVWDASDDFGAEGGRMWADGWHIKEVQPTESPTHE
jgi:hypothetical protein